MFALSTRLGWFEADSQDHVPARVWCWVLHLHICFPSLIPCMHASLLFSHVCLCVPGAHCTNMTLHPHASHEKTLKGSPGTDRREPQAFQSSYWWTREGGIQRFQERRGEETHRQVRTSMPTHATACSFMHRHRFPTSLHETSH